jgi:hypothetical protein
MRNDVYLEEVVEDYYVGEIYEDQQELRVALVLGLAFGPDEAEVGHNEREGAHVGE